MNKIIKEIICSIVVVSIILSTLIFVSCNKLSNDGITIIDSAGDEIVLPSEINRVVVVTEPAIDFMVALGIGDKIIGAYKSAFNNPWLEKFWPNCKNVEVISSYQPEAESLIAMNTDVIFVPTRDRAEALRGKGVCAITLRMYSPSEIKQGINILSQIFGNEVASKGKQWVEDFDQSISTISSQLLDVPNNNRKSCYQLMGDKYKGLFRTNYGDTLDYFIYGGGKSATSELIGQFTDAMPTEESVLGTNPDVIFVNGTFTSKLIVDLNNDERWSVINAVVNNEIYRTPVGFCDWSSDGCELILMNYWVFSKLYPDRVFFNIYELTNNFYKKYFNVTFTNEELDYMLNNLSPEGKELC